MWLVDSVADLKWPIRQRPTGIPARGPSCGCAFGSSAANKWGPRSPAGVSRGRGAGLRGAAARPAAVAAEHCHGGLRRGAGGAARGDARAGEARCRASSPGGRMCMRVLVFICLGFVCVCARFCARPFVRWHGCMCACWGKGICRACACAGMTACMRKKTM